MSPPRAPHPVIFSHVTGLGPRFLSVLAQVRHARKMRASRWGPRKLMVMSRAGIDATIVLAGLLLFSAVFVGLLSMAGDERGGCPNVSIRLNPYEYELQKRRCEAAMHRRQN